MTDMQKLSKEQPERKTPDMTLYDACERTCNIRHKFDVPEHEKDLEWHLKYPGRVILREACIGNCRKIGYRLDTDDGFTPFTTSARLRKNKEEILLRPQKRNLGLKIKRFGLKTQKILDEITRSPVFQNEILEPNVLDLNHQKNINKYHPKNENYKTNRMISTGIYAVKKGVYLPFHTLSTVKNLGEGVVSRIQKPYYEYKEKVANDPETIQRQAEKHKKLLEEKKKFEDEQKAIEDRKKKIEADRQAIKDRLARNQAKRPPTDGSKSVKPVMDRLLSINNGIAAHSDFVARNIEENKNKNRKMQGHFSRYKVKRTSKRANKSKRSSKRSNKSKRSSKRTNRSNRPSKRTNKSKRSSNRTNKSKRSSKRSKR